MNKLCEEKRRYPSIIEALDALIATRREIIVRVYKCHRCRSWHTTSQARTAIATALADAYLHSILD